MTNVDPHINPVIWKDAISPEAAEPDVNVPVSVLLTVPPPIAIVNALLVMVGFSCEPVVYVQDLPDIDALTPTLMVVTTLPDTVNVIGRFWLVVPVQLPS
jgi:hypothetical protein